MSQFSYQVIRSSRKTVSLQITPEGQVLVRCPRRFPDREIRRILAEKDPWIQHHLEKLAAAPTLPPFTAQELQALAQQLKECLPQKVAQFAAQLGVTYGRITVRAQHTRWGSCSAKGNLNFNCLLALVPEAVLDYVIVHELCHRKELNHSPRFWAAVEQLLPDYRQHKQWLKENGSQLIRRLP